MAKLTFLFLLLNGMSNCQRTRAAIIWIYANSNEIRSTSKRILLCTTMKMRCREVVAQRHIAFFALIPILPSNVFVKVILWRNSFEFCKFNCFRCTHRLDLILFSIASAKFHSLRFMCDSFCKTRRFEIGFTRWFWHRIKLTACDIMTSPSSNISFSLSHT